MTHKETTILFIEDELNLAEIVKESLESRGFTVHHYATATAALHAYHIKKPDLILLDVMLPDTDGFTVARQIRTADLQTPIIFLTSKSLPQDVVTGFENGGNDYLKKPFSMEELVVRIRALVSRNRTLFTTPAEPVMPVAIGARYSFHYQLGELKQGGQVATLTAREAALLQLLLLNKNQVVERSTILLRIWNNDDFFSGRSLDVFISRLRRYLNEDAGVKIINVRGIGYKLVC